MSLHGGHAHFLEPKALRLGDTGAPEAIKDTVKVLERYGHGIAIRIYTKKPKIKFNVKNSMKK